MASISKDMKNGTKRVVFIDKNGKRHFIRLGKISMKMAGTIKIHVENLVASQRKSVSLAPETADWVDSLPDEFHEKLAMTGLIPGRRKIGTLCEMIPKVIKEKSVDVKPATLEIFGQSERSLYRYFGEDKRVDQITPTEAKEFSLWLAKKGSLKMGGVLKPTTVAKRMQHVFSFFHELTEKGIISRNPFKGLAKKAPVDDKRNCYVDEETILKVMEYAPDAEWRLIIALWRFAGLRAASEVLSLKWEDILWDQNAIMVHAPKTERYQGKAERKIPFFPHIEGCLMEAAEQAEKGSIYVVEKHAPQYLHGQKERVYISRQGNLGTVFKKIIRRAGIVPWDKVIQNLRASFETDLLNEKYGKFGIHTIAYWLGHSVKVMLEHYGRIQKADYDKISLASQEVKKRKKLPTKNNGTQNGTLFVNFPTENEEVTLEYTVSNPQNEVAQKASHSTAERGEIGGYRAEMAFLTDSMQPLATTALSGDKRQKGEPCGTPSKPGQRMERDSNPRYVAVRRFSRPVP